MPRITIVYGLFLVVLGVGGYFGSGAASVTALIPAFFGVPVTICGVLALREHLLKHAMHGALLLALIGMFGAARGIPGFVTVVTGGEVERPMAVVAQTLMFVTSLVFIALCVRSFIEARRARAAG